MGGGGGDAHSICRAISCGNHIGASWIGFPSRAMGTYFVASRPFDRIADGNGGLGGGDGGSAIRRGTGGSDHCGAYGQLSPVGLARGYSFMTFNWLAIAVLIYMLLGAFSGWRRGLILVGLSLGGYVVGVLLASQYQAQVTTMLMASLPINRWVRQIVPAPALSVPAAVAQSTQLAHMLLGVLVFLLIVGGTEMIARLVGESLTRVVGSIRVLSGLNSLGGLAGGFAENALVTGLVLGLLLSLPPLAHTPIDAFVRQTPLAYDLAQWVGHLANWRAEHWLL